MEFRCRLGTANGEVVEGIYIADSEARLRRDLEEKGMFVLSLQPRGVFSGLSGLGTRRRRISRRSCSRFTNSRSRSIRRADWFPVFYHAQISRVPSCRLQSSQCDATSLRDRTSRAALERLLR